MTTQFTDFETRLAIESRLWGVAPLKSEAGNAAAAVDANLLVTMNDVTERHFAAVCMGEIGCDFQAYAKRLEHDFPEVWVEVGRARREDQRRQYAKEERKALGW